MPDTVPIDEQPDEDDVGAEPKFGDPNDELDVEMAKLRMDRLGFALDFVTDTVPSYGVHHEINHVIAENGVPNGIDLCRRRALVAAYGLIEREFSPLD